MATRKKGRSRRVAGSRGRSGGRYGARAGEKVERAMHEMKRGELRSGRSGKRVTNPKQAIAIGLSQARREGGKVPRPSSRRRTRRGPRSSARA